MKRTQYNYARGPQVMYSDPKLGADSYVTYIQRQTVTTVPGSTRRPKPKDLFRNGTPYGVVVESYAVVAPSKVVTKIGSGYQTQFYYSSVPLVGATLSPDLSALKSQILSKIKGQQMDLPVLTAELGKTTDMFFGLCRNVISGLKSLLRLRRRALWALKQASRNIRRKSWWMRKYRRLTKQLSNSWLEYAMGWKPTANDIWELSQALQTPRTEGDRSVRAQVKATSIRIVNAGAGAPTVTVREEASARAQARFTVRSRVISRAQQFGLTNPASVAWELIPFSFIVDYLVDVGDFLGNLDALASVENPYWQTGSRTVMHCSGPTYARVGSPAGFAWTSREVRNRYGSGPLTWSGVLTVDGKITAARTANMTALLRQQMRF